MAVEMYPGPSIQRVSSNPGKLETKELIADYTMLTGDTNYIVSLGPGTPGNRVFTLPSVGASEDGYCYYIYNDSYVRLTIRPSDTDSVWNAGNGYGLETTKKGSFVTLVYDHANTNWKVVNSGGFWRVEGLKLFSHFNQMTLQNKNTSTYKNVSTKYAVVNLYAMNNITATSIRNLNFQGVDEYVYANTSNSWDVFGSATGDMTVCCRVYCTSLGSQVSFVSHFEDSDNQWRLFKNAADQIKFYYSSGGTGEINLTGSTMTSTWAKITLVKKGLAVGLYLDADQVAYDNTWTPDTFTGLLFFAQRGDSSEFLHGSMRDVVISHSNLFNAAPNASNTDTITIPSNLNLVMGEQ